MSSRSRRWYGSPERRHRLEWAAAAAAVIAVAVLIVGGGCSWKNSEEQRAHDRQRLISVMTEIQAILPNGDAFTLQTRPSEEDCGSWERISWKLSDIDEEEATRILADLEALFRAKAPEWVEDGYEITIGPDPPNSVSLQMDGFDFGAMYIEFDQVMIVSGAAPCR